MKLPNLTDTIIAQSTASGQAAIAVVRLSGNDAIPLTDRFFKGKILAKQESHTLHYGNIVDEKENQIDDVVVGLFKKPNSYTKEDVVEISCHGSEYIVQEIIRLFLRHRVRLAEPGEFTMRAFLNGRMDLSQAEAVADLVASDSARSHEMAIKQMKGGISSEIKKLRQELIDFASLIELELDFTEEDVEFANRENLSKLIDKIRSAIAPLVESFELGNAIKNGVPTVIAGRPNAGKSTLLNALLQEERAIVSEIPGTTRDTIEEVLNIGGIHFRLIDTAGIRDAQDRIEALGVDRTMEKLAQSSIILYVFDVTELKKEELWKDIERLPGRNDRTLVIANKMDLNPYTKPEEYIKEGSVSKDKLITCSAINRMNVPYIADKLLETIKGSKFDPGSTIITSMRHYVALQKADESLQKVKDGMEAEISSDLLALDIRQALHHLGEITGEITTDDLLESIFSRFCIGK